MNGDVFGGGCQIYTIHKNIEPMGIVFQDEFDILYVNTKCQDDTDVGRLCHDFHVSDPDMVYDEILRERMRALKDSKKGGSTMCELVNELLREVEETTRILEHDKAFAEGYEEGLKEGRDKAYCRKLQSRQA